MPVTQLVTTVGRNSGPPTATYTLTPAAVSVNEGSSLTFTIGGTNIDNGSYFWTIETNAGDFTVSSGEVTISSNSGSFSVTPLADTTTEGPETFTVALRSVSTSGTILVTSAPININDTSLDALQPPFSLEFNQPQGDYLMVPTSNDWNLGTTGTIEFWINANNASSANIHIPGGQWGLINQGGWYYGMPDNSSILIGLAGGKLSIAQSNTDDVQYAEPTAGVWTHVAVVYNSGTQKVYYNGVEQTKTSGNYLGNGWTNTTSDLYIGRLAPNYSSHFDGKMALVRISNTAKYAAEFTPAITYGVEADTRLFLSSDNPLVDGKAHTVTNNGVALSNNVPTTFAPQSLQLVQSQTDYLDVAASSDWALSRTWTIEFWSKASKVSTENDLLTVMCQDYTDGNGIQIIYQGGSFEIQGTNRIAAEPTPGQWTHVALVNTVADGMTLYYNGVSQYTGGYWSLANNTNDIRIGARGTADFQRFDGNLAMIRISNTAKYTAAFTPTTTYGVESDTKLFLGTAVPLIDAKGHAITNHGVTTSSSAPQSLTGHPHPFNGGTFGSAYSVFGDPDIVAFSGVPVGARITSNIPNFGIRTVTSSQTNPVGWILTYDNTGLTGLTSTSDVFNFYW